MQDSAIPTKWAVQFGVGMAVLVIGIIIIAVFSYALHTYVVADELCTQQQYVKFAKELNAEAFNMVCPNEVVGEKAMIENIWLILGGLAGGIFVFVLGCAEIGFGLSDKKRIDRVLRSRKLLAGRR